MFKHTIRKKIFFYVFSLSMLSLLCIGLIVYIFFFQTLKVNETKYAVEKSDKTKQNLEFALNLIYNTATSLGGNQELLTELKDDSTVKAKRYEGQNKVSTMLQNIIGVQEYIKGIYILSPKGNFYTSNFGVKEEEIRKVYKDYTDSSNTHNSADNIEYFSDVHDVTYNPMYKSPVISYVRPIFSTDSGKMLGVILIDIDYDLLKEAFTISSIQNDEKVLVIGTNGVSIFTYPYNVILDDIPKENPILLKEKKAEIDTKVFGDDSIVVSNTIDLTNWKIIRVISAKKIHQDTKSYETLAVYIFIIFSLITSVVSFIVSSTLTKPIHELNKNFKLVEKGELSATIKIKSNDEMGELSASFNNMVGKLRMLISKLLEEQKMKSDMEFEILQAQINPHFLYNTLDSIKWLAVIQNVHTISDMTTALINLLKYNISKKVVTVSLAEELESVYNYIKIQKYRYGDIFEIEYNIAENTKELYVLRFVLQPIVENAIIHGFECIESKGIIAINSRVENENLIIEVADNGAGMDGDTLSFITSPDNMRKKFNGIGVQNIQDRIKAYLGEDYGLSFESKLGSGTKVILKLPVLKQNRSTTIV